MDEAKDTLGFGHKPQSMTENMKMKTESAAGDMKQSADSMYDAIKDKADSTQSSMSSSSYQGGGDTAMMPTGNGGVIAAINDATERRSIGGNQLFANPPDGTMKEQNAGHGFLNKYTNESAPGENTS